MNKKYTRLSKDLLINAVLSGIKTTQTRYRKWVNSNKSLSWGPEYLLTTYIAESIYESHPKLFVLPEGSIHDTMRTAGSQTRLSNSKRSINGRADIVVFHENLPKYIIEVKNGVSRLENIDKDLERLNYMVTKEKEKTSIEYGLMAFLIDVDYNVKTLANSSCIEKLDEKIKSLFKNAQENKTYGHTIHQHYYNAFEENEYELDNSKRIWGWAAVVFVIKPPSNR